MELRQLRHFEEIVRAASFGRAAEKLNITQPALSKSIRNLELSLGCKLFERHPSGVTPTEAGLFFLDYAQLVTRELDRAMEEMHARAGRGRGIIRIGAGATMTRYLLPQAVKRFMGGAEESAIVFRQGLKDELVAALRRGEVDAVVGSVDPARVADDLRQEHVMEDPFTVVAGAAHPLVGQTGVPLAALADFAWVLPETGEPETERLADAFARAGLPGPRVAIRTENSVFMARLLKDAPYLSYLPAALIALDPDYAHLVPVGLAEPVWERVVVGVTVRRRGVMLPPVRRFIERLKEVAREVGV